MGFDVYPSDGPISLAAGVNSGPIEIRARIGPDPAAEDGPTMFLRVIELGDGGATDPGIAIMADSGPLSDIALHPNTSDILDQQGTTVGNADRQREEDRVYFVRVRVVGEEEVDSWKLQITNTHPTKTRGYTFVVADNKVDTAQPWIDVSPVPEFTVLAAAVAHADVRIGNYGTGSLSLDDAGLPDLGAGFMLTVPALTVRPNSDATAAVTFTAPAEPGRAAATFTLISNDTRAKPVEGHNTRLRLAATVRAPRWSPGDLLVVDPQASDGGSAGPRAALLRIDPVTGVPTLVTAGGMLRNPTGVAVEADGNAVVCDSGAFGGQGGLIRVNRFNGQQTKLSSAGNFESPAGLVIAADGSIVVADPAEAGAAGRLIRVDPSNGTQNVLVIGSGLGEPVGLCRATDGSLVVLDRQPANGGAPQVRRLSQGGVLSAIQGGSLTVRPSGVAVDADGGILITASSTSGAGVVLQIDPAGAVHELAVGNLLRSPARLTVDAAAHVVVSDLRAFSDSGGLVSINPADGTQVRLSGGGPLRAPVGVTSVPGPSV